MKSFSKKVLNGEKPTNEEWVKFLLETHGSDQSVTPKAFAIYDTDRGLNSYRLLAETLRAQSPAPMRILDLACGDGYLIGSILETLGNGVNVVGIDISEAELRIARAKNFGPAVTFKCENAQEISEADDSFDGVLSHMALMLMNPVRPALAEVYRVLCRGCLFAAVIGVGAVTEDYYRCFHKAFREFVTAKYPRFSLAPMGDPLIRSVEGAQQLLEEAGFTGIEISDFKLQVRTTASGAWDFFKDMYYVTMLPAEDVNELRLKAVDLARTMLDHQGLMNFEYGMRLITGRKK